MLEYAADLMEVLGEGEFRAKTYRSAARNIEKIEQDLEVLAHNAFKGVAGVGQGLAPMLSEIVQSGEFTYLSELEGRVPPGVLELFRVQGLGPKRIRALWENGADSLEQLIRMAEIGRIRGLPGFGEKSEASLLEAARYALHSLRRVLLPVGMQVADLLLFDLKNAGIVAELAGSLRRGLDTIGNLDMVVMASVDRVIPIVGRYLKSADGDVVYGQLEGMPLRIFCATPANFGSTLFWATGSSEWIAASRFMPKKHTFTSEAEVFAALGQAVVPPYWREPEHIGLALPKDLLEADQLLGLIHNHTTYSDATGTLRQMAEVAIRHGYQYIVISDHSQTASYAGGLKVADVQRQWAEIDGLNAELAPFRILKGIESDILPDGSLDYPDEVLAGFDVVIGSLHANLGMAKDEQTKRLLRALENPYLSILGHPTGRLLLRRKGAEADWEAVLSHAEKYGKIVEFNCNAYRLDLDWRTVLAWRDRLNFSLGPDSHSLDGIEAMQMGMLFAHKTGLRPDQIVNTWPAEKLIAVKKSS